MVKITTPNDIPWLQLDADFPTAEQKRKIDEWKKMEKLYKGEFKDIFTMPSYKALSPHDKEIVRVAVNITGATSRAFSNLLFGKMPEFKSTTAQDWVDEFIERNDFENELYMAGDAQSFRGQAICMAWMEDGDSYCKFIPAEQWFPIESRDMRQRFDGHVVGWFEEVQQKVYNKVQTIEIFHATIYLQDKIYFWDYEVKNGKVKNISEREPTQIMSAKGSLIVPIYNLVMDNNIYGLSDYDETTVGLVEELGVRLTQLSNVLNKHADPTLIGGRNHIKKFFDQSGKVISEFFTKEDYLIVDDKDDIKPEYLTWDAKIKEVLESIQTIIDMIYMSTDTNPALFGQFRSGNIPSGSALKKMLIATIERKNRKKNQFKKGLDSILKTCYQLETSNILDLTIKFHSGITLDEKEVAEIASMRAVGKQTMSIERMLSEMDGLNSRAVIEEMAKIEAEMEKFTEAGQYQPGFTEDKLQSNPENGATSLDDMGRNE